MFSNILYFIIIFSLYAFHEVRTPPVLPPLMTAACVLLGYAAFYLAVKRLFVSFERKCSQGAGPFTNLHAGLMNRCMTLAVLVYAFFIYGIEVKGLFLPAPALLGSELAQALFASGLFFGLLFIIWLCAYPAYSRFYNPGATLRGYILSHWRLNSAIIAPWILFASALDLVKLLPVKSEELLGNHTITGYMFTALLFLLLCVFFPALLVRLWGCTPLPESNLRDRLDRFCRRHGFSYADILEWNLFEGKLITAGVLGIVPRIRYLLISPALLEILTDDEMEAVVAHEIGHIKRHHILFYLFFVLGFVFFAFFFVSGILAFLLSQDLFFDMIVTATGDPSPAFSLIMLVVLLSFLLLYFRLLFGFFSRNFERQADVCALAYTGTATGIIRSLEKIARIGSQSRSAPNWHHFGIQERIDYVAACESDPALVKKHDRKVRSSIAVYTGAFILFSALFFSYGSTFLNESELIVLEKVIEKRIQANPADHELHFMLGNIYFEKKELAKAETCYETALSLSPDNPEALNNLAWLYATAQEPELRNPKKALRLARRAAAIAPEPHILDTLAESYFVNGDYRAACEIIDGAIRMNPPDAAYYQSQRQKFLEHLRRSGRKRAPRQRSPGAGSESLSI